MTITIVIETNNDAFQDEQASEELACIFKENILNKTEDEMFGVNYFKINLRDINGNVVGYFQNHP